MSEKYNFKNAEELIEFINSVVPSAYGVLTNDPGTLKSMIQKCRKDSIELPFIIKEVSQTGGEGEGEYYEEVYKFTFDDESIYYISFEGHYSSWDGIEWGYEYGGCQTLVEPKEVTVIKYLSIEEN